MWGLGGGGPTSQQSGVREEGVHEGTVFQLTAEGGRGRLPFAYYMDTSRKTLGSWW